MTLEEAKKAIEELKAQGETEESMLGTFYLMFQDDVISVDELGDLCQLIGYELTDEFRNMSPEDQKTKGYEEVEDEDTDLSKEEIEDAKEIEPGEGGDDKKNNNFGDDKKNKSENSESEDDDKEEQEKAKKLFGF